MKKIYITGTLFLLLTACNTVKFSYVGSSAPPTQKVDVYVDEATIQRKYQVVGKGYAATSPWRGEYSPEKILAKAIEKAKKNGADAVFFRETWVTASGAVVRTNARTDSAGKGLVTLSNTTIDPVTGYYHREILFLRYN